MNPHAHPTITEFRMGGLDILPSVSDLSELGKHLFFGYSDMLETSETIICCGEPVERLRSYECSTFMLISE